MVLVATATFIRLPFVASSPWKTGDRREAFPALGFNGNDSQSDR